MGKTKPKKVAKRILVGFRKEALNRISERTKRTGQDETAAIHDLLTGNDRFGPMAEKILADEIEASGLSRDAVIEKLILRAMRAQ